MLQEKKGKFSKQKFFDVNFGYFFMKKCEEIIYTKLHFYYRLYFTALDNINCFCSSRSCCCSLLVTEVSSMLRFHPVMVCYIQVRFNLSTVFCSSMTHSYRCSQQFSCLFSIDSRLIRRYGFLYSFLQSCKSLSIRCDSYKIHSCNQQSRNSALSNIQR